MTAIVQPLAQQQTHSAAEPLVCWLEDCRKDSVSLVGGKCASLGELMAADVRVPPGFALTTAGYRHFMADSGAMREVHALLERVDLRDLDALGRASVGIRALIEAQPFSEEIEDQVAESHRQHSAWNRC